MKKNLESIEVHGKRVLVRCDFNVPLDEPGNILNDFRIKQTLPTIKYLIDKGAKVILMSHLDPESTGLADKKYNLNNIAQRLSELLEINIKKSDDCIGSNTEKETLELKPREVLLLENLRFYKEESDNNEEFAQNLAKNGDVYVNEAFSVCHRKHASVAAITKFLPAVAGFLLEKEIDTLNKVIENPDKPMVAIIGGKKVETKTKVIDKISEQADVVIVSGLIKKEAVEKNINFRYPDKIVGPEDKLEALDISQQTIDLFTVKIKSAKTVLWNGPFGKYEDAEYAKGTLAIAKAIIDSNAFSVVGGGETVEFLDRENLSSKFSHVSTGGGAMLAYLSGDKLPGLENLE